MASASHNFVPEQHMVGYQPMSKQYDRSPSPGRKFWPFNRSRSPSPNVQNSNTQDYSFGSRSRKSSNNSQQQRGASPSTSGFVVRSVTRQPGGVSVPSSPVGGNGSTSVATYSRPHASSSPARRMTLEDSDDDAPSSEQQQQQLQYRRSKSKPLGAPVFSSLGVPPGGPGGGVGYGTLRSSNDGRPEHSPEANQSSSHRPPSPGNITAAGFQKGLKERGRSPRKSPSQGSHASDQSQSASGHSGDSGASKKPVARITPGPKSLARQYLNEDHDQLHQEPEAAVRRGSASAPRAQPLSGPRQFPSQPQKAQHPNMLGWPRDQTPSPARQFHSTSYPDAHSGSPISQPSQRDQPGSDRRFSFGFTRHRKDSEHEPKQTDSYIANSFGKALPAEPLHDLPLPVVIPYGRVPGRFEGERSRSRDPGADTDYSHTGSPFGSVSPGGSPGFLTTLIGREQASAEREYQQQQNGRGRSSSPGGAGLAGKWFKGVFGRSPRADERDIDTAYQSQAYPDVQREWSREPTPSRDQPLFRSVLHPLSGKVASQDDEEARRLKMESLRQARQIVDAERRDLMNPSDRHDISSSSRRFDPASDKEYRPRQVVGSDAEKDPDAEAQFELERRKSPPGRKPVPRFDMGQNDVGDLVLSEVNLTPAQKIIAETRSRQLAREQIEAQRRTAATQQQSNIANRNRVPRHEAKLEAEPHQRFPSGAHKIVRESAREQPGASVRNPGEPPSTTMGPSTPEKGRDVASNRGNVVGAASSLSPGSGPWPMEMTLPQALQEMMVRFYRFERYSVPLIRSLETRLLDIERDAMMVHNPQSGARAASETSSQQEEMDRWVGQMTRLMKHEVGQLKAATKEIKEGRELVAAVARKAAGTGGMTVSASLSSIGSVDQPTPVQRSVGLTTTVATPSKPSPSPNFADSGNINSEKVMANLPGHDEHKSERVSAAVRCNNVSSSTFQSAIPRHADHLPSNLSLPPGSKPALEKSEGKYAGSPTKASFGFSSESSREKERERSVSPNGRPRYTSVLGQPLINGRLSPINSMVGEATSVDDSHPAPRPVASASSEHSSSHGVHALGYSATTVPKRDVSVGDRLKALVDSAPTRSFSSSSSASSTRASPADEEDKDADAEEKKEAEGGEEAASEVSRSHERLASKHSLDTVRQRVHKKPSLASASFINSDRGSRDVVNSDSFSTYPHEAVSSQTLLSDASLATTEGRPLPSSVAMNETTSSSGKSSSSAEPVTPLDFSGRSNDIGILPSVALGDESPPSPDETKSASKASNTFTMSELRYLSGADEDDSPPATDTPPLRLSVGRNANRSSTMESPTSGRISPSKLFSNKCASPSSMTSAPTSPAKSFAAFPASATTVAKLGLTEKKRFTLPSSVTTSAGLNRSGSISAGFPQPAEPKVSAAFSAAKPRPIGHNATLKERVAFFDSGR